MWKEEVKEHLKNKFVILYLLTLVFILIVWFFPPYLVKLVTLSFIFVLHVSILIGFSLSYSYKLLKSEKLSQLIISYSLLVCMVIVLFGYLYAVSGVFDNGIIDTVTNKTINGFWDTIYFSALVLYQKHTGFIPQGFSKILIIAETIVSFIIHGVILMEAIMYKQSHK